MAVKPFEITFFAPGVQLVKWELENGDTGRPITSWQYTDTTAQVYGTFGVNGAVQIEGSNDKDVLTAEFAQLRTVDRLLMEFSEDALEQVLEHPYLIRPTCSSGDGDTALTVIMCMSTTRG